jgi:hypothetical protein
MRFGRFKKFIGASLVASAACGLLLASFLTSSVLAPRASVIGGQATVSPFAMMMQAPLNLPVEQYDTH